jgi:flagellar assembly protein FliH
MNRPSPLVLRSVTLDAEPRTLQRAPAGADRSPPAARNAPSAATGLASRVADAERRSHAEGFARGREEGRQVGLADGMAEAKARVDAALRDAAESSERDAARRREVADGAWSARLAGIERIQRELAAAAEARLAALESDAIELAFAAVCRIVGDDAHRHRTVQDLVATALRARGRGRLLRVRVASADLAALVATSPADPVGREAPVEWIADASLESPGCVVESDQGELDARLETQLGRLRELWAEAARASQASSR